MPTNEIEISLGVFLIPKPAGVHSPPPQDRATVLRWLTPAKADAMKMMAIRHLLPGPLTHMDDDEVLEAIATLVGQRKMMLVLRTGTCTANKRRFFDWLAEPLGQMAKDLNTTKQIMLALAVKEGGWDETGLDHNQPLNNPFGMNHTNHGKASGNIGYATLGEAIAAWKQHRDYVLGVKDPLTFVNLLLAHNYNTQNPNYAGEYMGRYRDVGRAMVSCGVEK